MSHLLVLAAALLVDRIVGDPPRLWSRLPHPIVLFGNAIAAFDKHLNRKSISPDWRRRNGVLTIVVLLLSVFIIGIALERLFASLGPFGVAIEIVLVSVFLAQKSLADHVGAVSEGLRKGGIEGGRKAVSMIVGRDPNALDAAGVCRAAIESLAENFADGVVAPALWYALLGLPGLLAYKMLNTADSMIGHKSEKFLQFGWASARLDDIANWPAARLSLLLIAAGALATRGVQAARQALAVGLRDHGMHRSPNSGWPEAAMAGVLDLQLTGPRIYAGEKVSEPMINGAGRVVASADDIDAALRLFGASCSALLIGVLFLWGFVVLICG